MKKIALFNMIFHPIYWFIIFPYLIIKYPNYKIIWIFIPLFITFVLYFVWELKLPFKNKNNLK